jgi:hypothetical protein
MSMLDPRRENYTGELRLYIRSKHGKAWIGQLPRHSPDQRMNWQMWVRYQPGLPARAGKSPRRLLIESELRSWLLRCYHRPLLHSASKSLGVSLSMRDVGFRGQRLNSDIDRIELGWSLPYREGSS